MSPEKPGRRETDGPSFRDLYESQEKTDVKLERMADRLSRMEKGVLVLTAVILTPKLGGPDAAHLIQSAVRYLV